MECPCKDCTERTEDCHANCGRYKDWKIWHDNRRRQERLNRVSIWSPRAGYWIKKGGYWRNSKIIRRRK